MSSIGLMLNAAGTGKGILMRTQRKDCKYGKLPTVALISQKIITETTQLYTTSKTPRNFITRIYFRNSTDNFLVLAVLIIYFDLPVPWLLIPNFAEGILGFSEGFRMGCFSILSDVTTSQNRSFRMTILESVYVITGGVTNLIIGYLINDTGFLLPYAFTGVVQVINIIVIIFFIPELVQKPREEEPRDFISCVHFKRVAQLLKGEIVQGKTLQPRSTERILDANSYSHILCFTNEKVYLYCSLFTGGKMQLYLLLFGFLIFRLLFGGRSSVETLYQLNTPLCWNSIKIGTYFNIIKSIIIFSHSMKKFSAITYLFRILWFTFRRSLRSCWDNSGTNTAGIMRLEAVFNQEKTT